MTDSTDNFHISNASTQAAGPAQVGLKLWDPDESRVGGKKIGD